MSVSTIGASCDGRSNFEFQLSNSKMFHHNRESRIPERSSGQPILLRCSVIRKFFAGQPKIQEINSVPDRGQPRIKIGGWDTFEPSTKFNSHPSVTMRFNHMQNKKFGSNRVIPILHPISKRRARYLRRSSNAH